MSIESYFHLGFDLLNLIQIEIKMIFIQVQQKMNSTFQNNLADATVGGHLSLKMIFLKTGIAKI